MLRTLTGFICTLVLSAGTQAAIVECKMSDGGHLYEAVLAGGEITWEDAQAAVQSHGAG